jgi:hypothetical protein
VIVKAGRITNEQAHRPRWIASRFCHLRDGWDGNIATEAERFAFGGTSLGGSPAEFGKFIAAETESEHQAGVTRLSVGHPFDVRSPSDRYRFGASRQLTKANRRH